MSNQYQKIFLNDCINFAKLKNGKCLSNEYKNAQTKLLWECELGHNFQLAWKHIQYYKLWCPNCTIHIGEEICRTYFENIFKEKFLKIRPDWLKYKNNLELDGYCAKFNLAFEHNGIQHYQFHSKFHKNEIDFLNQKEKDIFKRNKCKELGIKLIEIPEIFNITKFSNLLLTIKNECSNKNINLPSDIDNLQIDLSNIKNSKNKLEYYKELAIKNGGECISYNYIQYHEKLKWKCNKNHIWEAVGFSIENGTWCPFCKKVKKYTIENAKELAIKKNGLCLSTIYIDANKKLEWKCDKNHIWKASLSSIKNLGTWCPTCRVNKKKIDWIYNE